MVKNPPFRIEEEGWGEFFMDIVFTAPDKDHIISHDLNFQKNKYEATHTLVSGLVTFETRIFIKLEANILSRSSKIQNHMFSPLYVPPALFPEMRMGPSPSVEVLMKREPRRRNVLIRM